VIIEGRGRGAKSALPEDSGQTAEGGWQREVIYHLSRVKSREHISRRQNTVDRRQKVETGDRGKKAEDRGRMADDRERKTEDNGPF
jgi:hypothetical protein